MPIFSDLTRSQVKKGLRLRPRRPERAPGRPLEPSTIDHVLAASQRWPVEQHVVDPQMHLFDNP
jgi:hypothetical protein